MGLISLGCAKNMVDAEIMLGTLMQEGFEITNDAEAADVVVVNTCSFIDAAQEESVDAILQSDALRAVHHRGQGLVVSGCLPQRFREDLPKLMPEVDAFIGVDQVPQIGSVVRQALAHRAARVRETKSKVVSKSKKPGATKPPSLDSRPSPPLVDVHVHPSYIPDHNAPRFRLTPRHFAYLKIAEGCNHPCSFCIIPRIRGTHRSRPQADVVQEARQLLADGVKELNLISQDSTFYGLDLRPQRTGSVAAPEKFRAAAKALPTDSATLCSLLRELDALPGEFWIRILYTHPAHWTDELIQTIAASRKVARYVDIPLQHIHENMLARMRRETSQPYIEDLLRRIREGIPGIAVRTTFIVGFPGETEEYFQTLLKFIREAKFERLGVFAYSREEGTVAGKMTGQIPDKTKQRRRELAMAAQHQVAQSVSASFVGRTISVLVEGEASDRDLKTANVSSWEHGLIRDAASPAAPLAPGTYLVARGEADAPDIDGRVYVHGKLPVGEFARVRVVGHTDYDLIAEAVS